MFPPGRPWFKSVVAPKFRYDPDISPEMLADVQNRLLLRDLTAIAVLESAHIAGYRKRSQRSQSFTAQKRAAIYQLVITGDCLERIHDDFTIQVYNRRNYVTQRNAHGTILQHGVRESIDIAALSEEQFAKLDIPKAEIDDDPGRRMRDMFTRVLYNPQSDRWTITQEIEGKIVAESEERVSPYVSTAVDLAPGEHYGRGIVEKMVLANLQSANTLAGRLLDLAYLASKAHPVTDRTTKGRAKELLKPSGTPLTGFRVEGGQPQDVGWLTMGGKINDMAIAMQFLEYLDNEISKALLSIRGSIRDSERTTGAEVSATAQEAELGLGGYFATMSDDQQVKTADRVFYQLERDKIIKPLPQNLRDMVELSPVTGMSHLAERRRIQSLLSTVDVVSRMGPDAMERISSDVLYRLLFEQSGAYEPGLIKSDEQMQRERQERAALQVQQAGAEAAIDAAAQAATRGASA